MNAPRHLYLDKSGTKLVPEDHPDAATLLAAKGTDINTKALHRAGLTLDDVKAHVEADAPAEQAPEGAQEPQEGEQGDTDNTADLVAELMALTRAELNAQAANCGVLDADSMPNKEAVARAIVEAQGAE